MKTIKLALLLLFSIVCLTILLSVVHADTITTVTPFDLSFSVGQEFNVQDLDHDALLTFEVQSGSLEATGDLEVMDSGGTFLITPSSNGMLWVTADITNVWIKVNGITFSSPYTYSSGLAFTVTWGWVAAPTLPNPIDYLLGGDISLLLQYLTRGDLLGFIVACYTTRIGQLFYAIVALIFTVPLALRTQSVTYVAIVWLLLAGIFQTAVPLIAPASVLLIVLAIGALFFKAFTRE